MKRRNGFTLIELLAVIVILAIIALIAVPVIINIVDRANKSALEDAAYGILKAGELYYAEQELNLNEMSESKTFILPTDTNTPDGIQINGEVPNGILKVNTDGETALMVSDGTYCITKKYTDTNINITEEADGCYFPYTLNAVATTSTNLGVNSVANCAIDGTKCEAGTAFAIKVNDEDVYKFRVLEDKNNVVTLIMSSNIYEEGNSNPYVAWLNRDHYEAAGGIAWDENIDKNTYGPLTALKALKKRTASWINIEKYNYTLDYRTGTYSGDLVQGVRARMPELSEITTKAIGCTAYATTCPDWMYEGLNSNNIAYWLSTAVDHTSYRAMVVNLTGTVGGGTIDVSSIGLHPVITISKSDI